MGLVARARKTVEGFLRATFLFLFFFQKRKTLNLIYNINLALAQISPFSTYPKLHFGIFVDKLSDNVLL